MNNPVTLIRIDSSQNSFFGAVNEIFRDGFDRRERGDGQRLADFLDRWFYRVYAAVDPEDRWWGWLL